MTKTRFALLCVTFLTACSNKSSLNPGSTSFVTDEPSYGDVENGIGGATDTATPATGSTTSTTQAPQGRTGTVEEADIYQVDQNRLFYFDTYRGFLVYDLSNAKNPQLVARLPVYGYPIEMYVDGNTVYALLSDALYVTQVAGKPQFTQRNVSQLVTIDVTNLASPTVLKTTDIIGELREGVSRKIDNTIYVVSYISSGYYYDFDDEDADFWGAYGDIDTQADQAWVYSFNVADAQNPQLVDKLQIFQGGDTTTSTSSSYQSKTFQDVQISATSNTLHVAENWQMYGWNVPNNPYDCGSDYSTQQVNVSIVDISDPNGAIKLYTKFSTYGHLSDQFKMTYNYVTTTQHAYWYGIFDRQDWYDNDCSGGSYTQNQLEVWDVTTASNPTRVGALPFGQNETVGGSTFDLTNNVAYAVTSEQTDPLYALGFSDPTNPTILSAVTGLSGSMSVFRFMDTASHFLLGIGADTSATCTGSDNEDDWWHSGVSVSIFDVTTPSAVKLVQRKCVDVEDAAFVQSNVNFDLDQGHKMIGDTSIGGVNIVAVPVNYLSETQEQSWWWWQYQSAVGLMTWDLTSYDPTKTTQTVLATHGSVQHPVGSVRRTIPFQHLDSSGNPTNMLLNLSDTYLSLYDISNIDAPVLQAETEVAPDIEALFRFGNYVVEHVRDEGFEWGFDTASEFRVKAAQSGVTVDTGATIASFTVGQVQNVVKWNNALVIFRSKTDPTQDTWSSSSGTDSEAVVYDLTDPTTPTLKSVTPMQMPMYPSWGFWCGGLALPWWGWWWGGASTNQWVSFDGGIAFMGVDWSSSGDTSSEVLVQLDLADLTAPKLTTQNITKDDHAYLALVADSSKTDGFYLTYREALGKVPDDGSLAHYHYYAQRWSMDANRNLVGGDSINVPGQLVRSWQSGSRTLFVTQDYRYTKDPSGDYYDGDPRLFLLEQNGGSATLLDQRVFAGLSLSGLVGDGDDLFVSITGAWNSTTQTYASDRLDIFDGSTNSLTPRFDAALDLTSTSVMGAGNGRLFVNLSGGGVLTLDVHDITAPTQLGFLRTLGWGSSLDIEGDTLYVAAGNFGVFQSNVPTAAK